MDQLIGGVIGLIICIGIPLAYDFKEKVDATIYVHEYRKKEKEAAEQRKKQRENNERTKYDVVWNRVKTKTGKDDPTFKRACYSNFDMLERRFRAKKGIRDSVELYNDNRYVNEDFLFFILGYLMAEHLWEGDGFHDEPTSANHELPHSESDYDLQLAEIEADLEGVVSWEEDVPEDVDIDDLEIDSDWDSDDYDSDEWDDDDDFDEYDSSERDFTFQDDYGYEGNDMYDFDGEFADY